MSSFLVFSTKNKQWRWRFPYGLNINNLYFLFFSCEWYINDITKVRAPSIYLYIFFIILLLWGRVYVLSIDVVFTYLGWFISFKLLRYKFIFLTYLCIFVRHSSLIISQLIIKFSDLPYWLGLHQYTDIYNWTMSTKVKTNHHKIIPWLPTNLKVNTTSMDNTYTLPHKTYTSIRKCHIMLIYSMLCS
jgi:hypothetical protein